MRDQKLYESVGKYIDKYYIDKPDDIKLDKEMKSIFDRISEFRKKKATKKCDAEEDADIEIDESAVESFDVESMQKTKATDSMYSTLATNRNIESLMEQMDETFSQRLLRLIDERGMTDSEAYNKAYVDRRHFSKIRKDVNYTPNKKTVLAFAIALELSIDEAKDLLNSAGFAFSRSSKTDIIVAYFLQNKIYDMFEINEILDAYGQPIFFFFFYMQKEKKRMYVGGKSVLHVINSAGGFYKVKKTGRLGKNCVHFSGRGICSKYDKWCSSANCPGYEKRK